MPMDPKELDKDESTIADVVTREKPDAVSSGIVKDDVSQSLSVLADKESALGERAGRAKGAKAKDRKGAQKPSAEDATSAQAGSEATGSHAPEPEKSNALKARQMLARKAVSELDDTDEFEGSQGAYDIGKASKRGAGKLGSLKSKGGATAKGAAKPTEPARAAASPEE